MSTIPPTPDSTGASYLRLLDLSEGGMGRVELTIRKEGRFERLYAVKRLQPALRDEPTARKMFLEEGRLAGLIHHPHVVGVLDVGSDEQGPYLAMEYVDGITAHDLVVAAARTGLLLPVQLCCRVCAQAARGLASAHTLTAHDGTPLNLVHRDVCPRNLLVGYDGLVRVADFGIARANGRDYRTNTGVLKGKLGYMAPETLRFEPASPRSDLFSLGVVLFEMLTSSRLYGGGDDAARARRILGEAPPDVGEHREDVPIRLQELLVRMLAKNPTHRPASASEVAAVLDEVADTLIDEEGDTSIETFVATLFGPERDARRAEVQRARCRVEEELSSRAIARATDSRARPRYIQRPVLFAVLTATAVAVAIAIAIGGATLSAWLPWATKTPTAGDGLSLPVETVELNLLSEPPGAEVSGGGIVDARTPIRVEVRRSPIPVMLRFALEGHTPAIERIVPDVDQRLRVQLDLLEREPAPVAALPDDAQESGESPPSPRERVQPRVRGRERRRARDVDEGFRLFRE